MSLDQVAFPPGRSGVGAGRQGIERSSDRPFAFVEDGTRFRSPSDAAHLAIESIVAQVFGVTHAELAISSRGKAPVALARQVAMYLTHVVCRLTFTEVGQLFGRDRTTVAHACEVVEDRRDDPVFDRALDLLEWALPSLLCRAQFGEANLA